MAKLIIVDGPSRSGKGTITARLTQEIPEARLIRLAVKRPEGIEDLSAYYAGMTDTYQAFLSEAREDDVYILDRSMFTHEVYSQIWGDEGYRDPLQPMRIINGHQTFFVYTDATYEMYVDRGSKDHFTYTEAQYNRTRELFQRQSTRLHGHSDEMKCFGPGVDLEFTVERILAIYNEM